MIPLLRASKASWPRLLQTRPEKVTADLFKDKVITDARGNEQVIDGEMAQAIYFDMVVNGYVDKKGALTDKYYADKANAEKSRWPRK